MKWCPTDEITGDFLTKPNQGSIFKRFRDLIMGVMPQTDPNNKNRATKRKSKLRKGSKSKRISGRRDKYQKHPHECVADQRTDSDQHMIRIKTVFESQKPASQRSIQQDME